MKRRVMVALSTALVGGLMFVLSQRVIGVGMLPSSGLVGLVAGAVGATLIWYTPRPGSWFAHLIPALLIVEVTLACIGLSIGVIGNLDRVLSALPDVLGAVSSMLFFGLIYATWWLVPGLATMLWVIDASLARHHRPHSH